MIHLDISLDSSMINPRVWSDGQRCAKFAFDLIDVRRRGFNLSVKMIINLRTKRSDHFNRDGLITILFDGWILRLIEHFNIVPVQIWMLIRISAITGDMKVEDLSMNVEVVLPIFERIFRHYYFVDWDELISFASGLWSNWASLHVRGQLWGFPSLDINKWNIFLNSSNERKVIFTATLRRASRELLSFAVMFSYSSLFQTARILFEMTLMKFAFTLFMFFVVFIWSLFSHLELDSISTFSWTGLKSSSMTTKRFFIDVHRINWS